MKFKVVAAWCNGTFCIVMGKYIVPQDSIWHTNILYSVFLSDPGIPGVQSMGPGVSK